MKNREFFSLILIAMLIGGIPCLSAAAVSNPAVFILTSDDDPLWNQIRTGIEDVSRESNIPVTILTTDGTNQAEDQVIMAFDALSESPSSLILTPLDASLFTPVLKAAEKAGIQVFILGSPLKTDISHVYIGSDNDAIGVMAADDLASMLKGTGTIAIISQNNQDPVSLIRGQSFIEQIHKEYPGIILIPYNSDSETGLDIYVESLLAAHPDIRGFFSPDADATRALGSYIEKSDMEGSIAIVGVGDGEETKELVTNGTIQEVIIQDPYKIGYTAGESLRTFLKGEEIKPEIFVETTKFITDVPFVLPDLPPDPITVTPQAVPSSPPASTGDEEGLSYEDRLRAAADRYDFLPMTEQNAASHYSTINQIALNQLEMAYATSSTAIPINWKPGMGYSLVRT